MTRFFQRVGASFLAFWTIMTGLCACTGKRPGKTASKPDVASIKEADMSFSADRIHFLRDTVCGHCGTLSCGVPEIALY